MGLLEEFRKFAIRGNAVDLAIGVVIGAAFGKIVSALVDDIIMPPLSFLIGRIDFSKLVFKINYNGNEIVLFKYGDFINALIYFLIVAWALFIIVQGINKFREKQKPPPPLEPPKPSRQEQLLAEIRDLLKNK